MTPTVTICPAAAAAQTLPEEPQWGEFRQLPAGRESALDMADYARAHTIHHALNEGRRISAPAWAFNGLLLAEIICRMFEQRAGFRKPLPGGNLDRLAAAQRVLFAAIPRTQAILKRLCDEYVQLKQQNDPTTAKRRHFLETEIRSLDTTIHLTKSFPATCARVCYLYYNLGWNSVAIGEACGIQPPLTRKIIWKMHRTWELLQREKAEGVQPTLPRRFHLPKPKPQQRPAPETKPRPVRIEFCVVCTAPVRLGTKGRPPVTCPGKCREEFNRRRTLARYHSKRAAAARNISA